MKRSSLDFLRKPFSLLHRSPTSSNTINSGKERAQDEAAVSKLYKDLTTGALRRKRGAGDDLDLSDEEDQIARRREAKRREFARMRRELLRDEAVGKIAEDRKKQAFLKSIEDHDMDHEDDDLAVVDDNSTQEEASRSQHPDATESTESTSNPPKRKRPLQPSTDDTLNRLPPPLRRIPKGAVVAMNRKPSTLAEIRESVSFLVEDPSSHSSTPNHNTSDSDSDSETEAYVDLNRHIRTADDDDEDDGGEDLGDFVVDDEDDERGVFKKPTRPPPMQTRSRAPFSQRRTGPRPDVVDRLSLLRRASSSSSSSTSNSTATTSTSKMAFFTSTTHSNNAALPKVPTLLRRATTNSSLSVSLSNESASATGVTTAPERGTADQEKKGLHIRKGTGGRRNAVNYRVKPRDVAMEKRTNNNANNLMKKARKGSTANAGAGGFLGALFRADSWE